MECLNKSERLGALRSANSAIDSYCERYVHGTVEGTAEEVADGLLIQTVLENVAALLVDGIGSRDDPEIRGELARYRRRLLRLRSILSAQERMALRRAERSRSSQSHLRMVAAWCSTYSRLE